MLKTADSNKTININLNASDNFILLPGLRVGGFYKRRRADAPMQHPRRDFLLKKIQEFLDGKSGVFNNRQEQAFAQVLSFVKGHNHAERGAFGVLHGNMTALLMVDEKYGFAEGFNYLISAEGG